MTDTMLLDNSHNRGILGGICAVLIEGLNSEVRKDETDSRRKEKLLHEYHKIRRLGEKYHRLEMKCKARQREITSEIRKIGRV